MAERLSDDANVSMQFARAIINAIDEYEIPNAASEEEIVHYNKQMAKFALNFAHEYTKSQQPIENNADEITAQRLVNGNISIETARAVVAAIHGIGISIPTDATIDEITNFHRKLCQFAMRFSEEYVALTTFHHTL